jgi:hypothetical protein
MKQEQLRTLFDWRDWSSALGSLLGPGMALDSSHTELHFAHLRERLEVLYSKGAAEEKR